MPQRRRPCPANFDEIFVKSGRLEAEAVFGARRTTITAWLIERGMERLVAQRAAFVRQQRMGGLRGASAT